MATIVLIIEDNEDQTDIKWLANPSIKAGHDAETPAQQLAVMLIDYIQNMERGATVQ